MADIIHFPIERRRPRVELSWDRAWDCYRIQAVDAQGVERSLEFGTSYAKAIAEARVAADMLDLPLVDLVYPADRRGCSR